MLSPDSLILNDNIRLQAQVAYLTGDYIKAEKQIDQVLDKYERNSTPKYISFATALMIRGLILNKLGKGNEAENVLREALKLRIENLPAKHLMIALTKNALGEILTSQKKFDEAENLLQESYTDLKLLQANENNRVLTAKRRLDELFKQKTNK